MPEHFYNRKEEYVMALPGFIKVKGESVYYSGDKEFLLFIPEIYFDRKCAVVEGEYVQVLGVLNYALTPNPAPKDIRTFYFPSIFVTKPGRIEKVKKYTISKNVTADYTILHYTDNGEDQIITSTKTPEDMDNVEYFFRLFVDTGNILGTIKYHDLYKYFFDSIEINGNSYNLPASLFGLMISELCRDPDDNNKPFRLGTNIDKDPYSYESMSIKDVPTVVSPFTSLTSENFDKAVVGAIMNQNYESTPLERVLTG